MSVNRPEEHHPCSSYLESVTIPDLKVKQCRPNPRIYTHKCKTSTIIYPPEPCYEEKVYMYKCEPPPPPPPSPPPDKCKVQAIKKLIKAGKKICPIPEQEADTYKPPDCKIFICTEKIKNPPINIVISKDMSRPVCVVERVLPNTHRCDEIARIPGSDTPLAYPCAPHPPLPPPTLGDPCETIGNRKNKKMCVERLKQYYSEMPSNYQK